MYWKAELWGGGHHLTPCLFPGEKRSCTEEPLSSKRSSSTTQAFPGQKTHNWAMAGYGSHTEITDHSTGRKARQREESSLDGYKGAWYLQPTSEGLTNPAIRTRKRNAMAHALILQIPAADALMERYAAAASVSARLVLRTAMVNA